jgi:outer membrane lipoprotein-sorting protein
MGRLHLALALCAAIAVTASSSARAGTSPLDEAVSCLQRNAPKSTLSFRAEFTKFDRVGGSRSSRASVQGKKLADSLRRVVLRFDRPPDVRGTAMLMIENSDGPNDFYVWSPGERRVRRVLGRSNSGLFGTDFSYDDFENWRTFSKHGSAERLDDATIAGRAVYVIATKPAAGEASSYDRIVTSIDRETCVVLQVDSFEPGGKLRKVLKADPASLKKVGEFSLATALDLSDAIEQTHTTVAIDEVSLDTDIPDGRFRPTDLSSGE